MKKVWEFIKKYWKIVIGAIAAFLLYVLYQKKVPKASDQVKEKIKELDKKDTTIQTNINQVEAEKKKVDEQIKKTDEDISKTEEQINNIDVPKTDTKTQTEFLKNLSKK